MTKLASRFGNKTVYASCLLFGAVGFAGLVLLKDKYALMLPMLCIGIAWAGILAMPYAEPIATTGLVFLGASCK